MLKDCCSNMQIYRCLRVVLRNLSKQKGYMVTAVTRNHSVSFPDVVDNRFTESVDNRNGKEHVADYRLPIRKQSCAYTQTVVSLYPI